MSWWDAVTFANRLSHAAGLEPCYQLAGCTGEPGAPAYSCESARLPGLSCGGYRLPAEAEWEYAARAGTTTALYTGDLTIAGLHNGPELDAIAWYGGNSGVDYQGAWDCSSWSKRQFPAERCGTHPVAGKAANAWGLRDMLGNVWEWTGDYEAAYPTATESDPTGPDEGSSRVVRGGSWDAFARRLRAAYRVWRHPGSRDSRLGLRLARGQAEPGAEPR